MTNAMPAPTANQLRSEQRQLISELSERVAFSIHALGDAAGTEIANNVRTLVLAQSALIDKLSTLSERRVDASGDPATYVIDD